MFDLTEGININYFIPPMILLFVVPTVFVLIYAILFRRILPAKIFNFFLAAVLILGLYVWAVPMKLGLFEYFRATF